MTTPPTCPRCKSVLIADAQFCSRCGLRLPQASEPGGAVPGSPPGGGATAAENAEEIEPFDFQSLVSRGEAFDATEYGTSFLAGGDTFTETEATSLDDAPETSGGTPTRALQPSMGNAVAGDSANPQPSVPLAPYIPTGPDHLPSNTDTQGRAASTDNGGVATPPGALDLLPQEEVIQRLGALYLTNKRVILLASSVIRSAFVRDIDAVGTKTEHAPLWQAVLGGALIGLAAGALYAGTFGDALRTSMGWAFIVNPLITAVLLAAAGIFLLARYFLWIKRSLFVSVKGRPLITVSMSGWNSNQLAGMDAFVNAFFQVKDSLSGELAERQFE